MQYKFFVVPVKNINTSEQDLNKFLRSHKILSIKSEFVSEKENSYWAIAAEYIEESISFSGAPKRSKIDYKELLNEKDFALFDKLRKWRKKKSEEEGVQRQRKRAEVLRPRGVC